MLSGTSVALYVRVNALPRARRMLGALGSKLCRDTWVVSGSRCQLKNAFLCIFPPWVSLLGFFLERSADRFSLR